jgi:hypothetical protein
MSPERKAAPHTFQLCRYKLAMGAPPEPKRCMPPPGSCKVSVPYFSRDSSFMALRAAAGASAGSGCDLPIGPGDSAQWLELVDDGVEFIGSQRE